MDALTQNNPEEAEDENYLGDGDYRTLRTAKERLDRGVKLFKQHVLDPSDEQGAEELSPEHIALTDIPPLPTIERSTL